MASPCARLGHACRFFVWRFQGSADGAGAGSDKKKYCLRLDGKFREESASQQVPDPTYGKLAVEADRVALASMTSILVSAE